ncbi:uncharacterized protein LOC121810063 [Salvia splendens]|uniref:uncharacterized protein LOC121810063 n=1 Tax=Salvia splendens TaxID=180675 RepID=UPI001C2739B9|nr:uncharacterized protein LOC121810063 [Salvia splendens]
MCEKMEKGTTDITDIVFSQQNKEREEESIVGNPKEEEEEEEKKNCGDDSDQNGGVLSGLIAGIFHPSQESDEAEAESSASLMDNIVSHLPAPLSDDAAPATEEASILIHAIVHD